MCLGNISKDWSVDNLKKTGLKGYAYDFSVDYDYAVFWCIRHSQVFDEKEWNSVKCLGLLNRCFLKD